MTKITYTVEEQDNNQLEQAHDNIEKLTKSQLNMFGVLYREIQRLHAINETVPSNEFQAWDLVIRVANKDFDGLFGRPGGDN